LDLPALLSAALRLKQRARGASDTETLLALIYSLAQGEGALWEVDLVWRRMRCGCGC